VARFSLQDTALASLTDARQQARELQEQLRGRLGSVYLEQCRTVAPDFRARGRRCNCTSCCARQWRAEAATRSQPVHAKLDAACRLGEMLLLQLRRDVAPEDISALSSPPPDETAARDVQQQGNVQCCRCMSLAASEPRSLQLPLSPTLVACTGGVHYWSVPNTGSAESDLHAVPAPNAATSMEYAYMLGLVDRLSSPLLEPFVDGAVRPCCRGRFWREQSGPEPSFQQLSCR